MVEQLEQYQRNDRLLPTTKFITIAVKNLYTMIPRGGALDALYRFCTKYGNNGKIGNMTVHIIIRLAYVVLETNCFVFDNKYYTAKTQVTHRRFVNLKRSYLENDKRYRPEIFNKSVSRLVL